ncbi:unnamed protein product [Rotaria sordida]|uniref:Schwannomin interacting protein 1 C-terminal domain-containing protein n=1 Tax=Rotaria sordida TaxID=392033 RepID=A0A815HTG5_9BILA|nr:unnamed protein product [Rotaria sordida]CAF1603803.1 unnamed protein product [Rotaria sordida]
MDLYLYYLYNKNIKFDSQLELKARDEIISNDSECENEDYIENKFITTHQQGLNYEHNQTNKSIHETNSSTITHTNEDIFIKQQKLKEEAKVALVLGAKMARMQVEIERQLLQKKSPSFYDIIGLNTNGDKSLTIDLLKEMNIGQLQAIINDLYCRIEMNNNELVNLLIERDSLSMEQDSILVDIEDLTKRLEEHEVNLSKQLPSNERPKYVYIVKNLEQDVPKKSIFQYLFRKTMFM